MPDHAIPPTTSDHPASGHRPFGQGSSRVDHTRADLLIHAFAGISALGLIGMLVDSWQLVFLTVPLFAVVIMLQGAMTVEGVWDRLSVQAIIAYCAGLAAMVVASVATAGSDAEFWGLPVSMGLIVYVIWPYTAAVSGLLYAFVFDRTLSDEVTEIVS